jgi:hypothetical protein
MRAILTAAVLAALACPVVAANHKGAKGKTSEDAMLTLRVTAKAAGGAITATARGQAQNQLSSKLVVMGKGGRTLVFNAVPVINPNNGRLRVEFKATADWSDTKEHIDLASAAEIAFDRESVVYDAEGVSFSITASKAD